MPPEKVILHIFNYFIKQVIKEAGLKSASIFLGIGGSSREMEDKSSAKVTFYVDVREGADKAMIGAQNKDTYLEHDVSVSIMQNTDKYRSQKWLTEDDSLLDIIERIRFKLQAINHIPKDDVVVYSIKHTDREYDIADAQNIIGTSTYEVKSRYTPTAAPAVIQLDKITTRIRGPHTNVPTEPSLEPLDPTQFTVDFVPGGKKFTIVNVDAYLVREDEDIEIKLSNNRYVGDSVRVEFRPNTEGTISYTNSETAVISIEAHPTEENILLINFLDDGISEVEFIFTPDDAEYVTDTYSVTITSCPAFSVVLADNSPVPDSVEVGNTLNLKAIAKLGTLITFESTDETLLTLTKGSVQNINGMAIHNFTAEALAEGAVSLSFTQAAVSGTDAGTTLTFALSVASATLIPQSITLDLRDASNAAVDLTTFSGRIDDVYTGTLSSTYVDSNGDTVSTGLMNYTLSSSDDSLATITPASTTDGTFTITFLQAGDVQFNLLQPGDTTYNTRTLVQTATIMKRAQTVAYDAGQVATGTVGSDITLLATPGVAAPAGETISITYTSGDTTRATVSADQLTLVRSGSVVITATASATTETESNSTTLSVTINVRQATLSITAGGTALVDGRQFEVGDIIPVEANTGVSTAAVDASSSDDTIMEITPD